MTTRTRTKAIWAEAWIDTQGFIMGSTTSESGLPWDTIPEDLGYFRERTRDNLLIMGRNTFDHLPNSMKTPKALAERPIVIITKNPNPRIGPLFSTGILELDPTSWATANAYHDDLEQLVDLLANFAGKTEVSVIGGAGVIELFEPAIDELHVSTIKHPSVNGDIPAPTDNIFKNFESLDVFPSFLLLGSHARVHVFERSKKHAPNLTTRKLVTA